VFITLSLNKQKRFLSNFVLDINKLDTRRYQNENFMNHHSRCEIKSKVGDEPKHLEMYFWQQYAIYLYLNVNKKNRFSNRFHFLSEVCH